MIDDVMNRMQCKRGDQLPHSKLTADKVKQILNDVEYRKKLDELRQDYTNKALAIRYGVHHRTIECAISGHTWSHVVPD